MMILATRDAVATKSIGWTLSLLVISGTLSACSPDDVAAGTKGAIVATPIPFTPTAAPEENETPLIEPTSKAQETRRPPTIEPAATEPATAGTLAPIATIVPAATPTPTDEWATPVLKIPLAGPAAGRDAQLSGLAWYGDHLILLPQYPDFNDGQGDGFIYALPKSEIIAFLDGEINHPLEPRPIPFVAPGLSDSIAGFEGYEAIAFSADGVYVTIETRAGGAMLGYLARGTIAPDLSALTLDTSTLASIAPQSATKNMSEESLFVADQVVGAIYELNGRTINAAPIVHLFDLDLTPVGTAGFPNVDFRITDASDLDQDGRFWAINYFFPGSGDFVAPQPPEEGDDNGDHTWLSWEGMGRLIEFQFTPSGIALSGAAPIQLESLLSDIHNWEGLARLDDRGFLIASDEIPNTVLGFVPFPEPE